MDGLSAVEARMAELQGMLAAFNPPVPASASFASVLDQVQAQTAPTGTATAPSTSTTPSTTAPTSTTPSAATPAPATPAPAAGTVTRTSWARDLLTRLHAPVTASNLSAVVSWEMAEGGYWNNTASFNPLNTTQREPGSSAMNSVGVQAYSSYEVGMQATIQTLQNGDYSGILAALQQGTSAEAVRQAVVTSPWGTTSSAFTSGLLATGADVVAGRTPDETRPA